jgi:hypothetical protein
MRAIALGYAIRQVQEAQIGLKLIWSNHLVADADDTNLLGNNMDTITENKTFN